MGSTNLGNLGRLFARRPDLFPRWAMRRGLLATSLVLFGLALALVAWPLLKRRTLPNLPPPRVFVAGQAISLGPEGDGQALDAVRRYAQSSVAVLLPRGDKGERRAFSRALLGGEIDRV